MTMRTMKTYRRKLYRHVTERGRISDKLDRLEIIRMGFVIDWMGKGGFGKGSKESEGKEEDDMVNWKMRVNGEKKSDKKKQIENK